jgi:hypothetical protein
MNETDADRRTDLMAVHILRHLRECCAYPFGHLDSLFPVGLEKHCSEFVAAEPTDQIRSAHRFSSGFRGYRQNPIADRVPEAVIDCFEVIEIDQ